MKKSTFLFLSLILFLCLLVSCGGGDGGGDSDAARPPEFKILHAPAITLGNQESYKVAGTCTKAGGAIIVTVGSLLSTSAPCDNSFQWQVLFNLSVIHVGDFIQISATELEEQLTQEVVRDVTSPIVSINSNQAIVGSINQGNYRLAGICDETDREVVLDVGGITVHARCDGTNWEATGIDLSPLELADDVTSLTVTADLADAVGNAAEQAQRTLSRDVIPPSVGITAPLVINKNSINTYSLEGSCEEDATGSVTVKVAGLSDKTIDCTGNQWSLNLAASELSTLPEANNIAIVVEHRDTARNTGRDDTGQIHKDTREPVLQVTSGLAINSANDGSYSMEGECSESGRSLSITVGSGSAESVSCDSGRWTFSPTVSSEGSFDVSITQEDLAENTGTLNVSLLRDVTAPTVGFGSSLNINAANENAYHVSGTCSEAGMVTVSVEGISDSQEASCNGSTWRTPAFNTVAITASSVQLSASMVDLAGNPHGNTAVTKSVEKNTSIRAVTIHLLPSPSTMASPINKDNVGSYSVSGTCSNHPGDVTVTIGSASTTGSCSGRSWQVTIAIPSNVADALTVTITATFGSGSDQGSYSTTALKDTVDPILTFSETPPPINSLNQGSYALAGTCPGGPGGSGQVMLNIGGISVNADCTGDAWNTGALDLSDLADSSIAITVDVQDAAGNAATQKRATVARDVEAPSLAITSAEDITTLNWNDYFISGTCGEEGEQVKITVVTVPYTANCTSGAWRISPPTSNIPEGRNLDLVIKHADSYENVTVINDTIHKDTVRPIVSVTSDTIVGKQEVARPYLLAGVCEGDGQVSITVGTQNPVHVNCVGGLWEHGTDLSVYAASDQDVDVEVNQWDDLQNQGQSINILSIDVTPPTVTINTPTTITSTNEANYPVSGECSEVDEEISITVGGVSASPSPTCQSGTPATWSTTDVDISSLGRGNLTITATHVDAAGNTQSASPQTVVKPTGARSILLGSLATGGEHTCALQEGKVLCWGNGGHGRLGHGSTEQASHPVTVKDNSDSTLDSLPDLDHIVQVSASISNFYTANFYTCAVESNGRVWCWGKNRNGVLGIGEEASDQSAAVLVKASSSAGDYLDDIVQVGTADSHNCALKSNGRVLCWGANYTRLGIGSNPIKSPYPVQVKSSSSDSLTGVTQITTGIEHSCALKDNGNMWCWGRGSYGKLGNGESRNKHYATQVKTDGSTYLKNIAQISAGSFHTCALDLEHRVWCWGRGNNGQLGRGEYLQQDYAQLVLADGTGSNNYLDGVMQVVAGNTHTCALMTDGTVKCWGNGRYGKLGDGNVIYHDILYPNTVSGLRDVVQISSRENHACAVTLRGRIRCWGHAGHGRLGSGHSSEQGRTHPVLASSEGSNLDIGTFQASYRCTSNGSSCTLNPLILALQGGTTSASSSTTITVLGLSEGKSTTVYSDTSCQTSVGTATADSNTVSISGLTRGVHRYYLKKTSCLPGYAAYVLDDIAPVLPGVEVVPGSYRLGETVNIRVVFDEEVFLTGGTPQLHFVLGASGSTTNRVASYTGGSGSKVLQFSYTIAAGDEDSDGIAWGHSGNLDLNGASLADAQGNAATTISLGATHWGEVSIDLTTPTVSVARDQANGSWNWGCAEENCTYRYAIVAESDDPGHYTFAPDGAYGNVRSAIPANTGAYYLYVQARDGAKNPSQVERNGPLSVNSVGVVCGNPEQASGFQGGEGTATSPWSICTYAQLEKMGENLNAHYSLAQNIDAGGSYSAGSENCTAFDGSNKEESGVCTGWTPLGQNATPFQGTFNGNGFAISSLYTNVDGSGEQYAGLFAVAGASSGIFRVSLTDVDITATASSSAAYSGALVGLNAGGTIQDTYSSGPVTANATSAHSFAGGLVGFNRGTISSSYTTGAVTATTANEGTAAAGGLAGRSEGVVQNSYAEGKVTASTSDKGLAYGGGVVGILTGTVDNSYFTGNTEANGTNKIPGYGGLIGQNYGGVLQNSYTSGTTGNHSLGGGLVGDSQGTFLGVNYHVGNQEVNRGGGCPPKVCKVGSGGTSSAHPLSIRIEAIKKLLEDEIFGWSDRIWGDLLDYRYPCLLGVTPNCLRPEQQICLVQSQKAIWTGTLTMVDIGTDGNVGISGAESFTHDGTSYSIDELYWDNVNSAIVISFTADVSAAAANWGALKLELELEPLSLLFGQASDADASAPGESYRWVVANSPGLSDGDSVSVTLTENTRPAALSATASGSAQINLSWTEPEDDDDTPPITGYRIDFSLDNGSNWRALELHTLNRDTSYSHTGLNSNTNYCYRVSAVYPSCRAIRVSEACTTTAR